MKEKIQDLPVFMSRRELADMMGVSEFFVRSHESELGLDKCRVRWKLRHVKYVRSMAMEILISLSQSK